jgi:type II secretory pathway predicted ATPase ExeA
VVVDLYLEHFGFSERPFTLLPDPDFLFWSDSHKRAFAVLEYGLMTQAPLTVVTGEVGTGKTTLVHMLLRQITSEITVALISNATGGRGDLLRWILNAFDVKTDPSMDYVALFQRLQDFIIHEYSEGRHAVIIIDEAQNLNADILEELRMLTNVNSNKDELLQIILVGQPELRDIITREELRQFAQRVTAIYHLPPLDLASAISYVKHRLSQVGGSGREITIEAIEMIHEHAGGIPRVINKICDISLVYAANTGKKRVLASTIDEVIADGLLLLPKPKAKPLVLDPDMKVKQRAAE